MNSLYHPIPMDEDAQLEALQADIEAKQARLLELKTKYY